MRDAGDGGETIWRAGDLAGGVGVIELKRVGPDDGGQALALFVVGGQIERERKINAVGALVGHKLLGNALELRRGIRKVGERLLLGAVGSANKVVRRLSRAFMPGEKLCAVIAQQSHGSFIMPFLALEDALGFAGFKIEAVEEGELAFGRGSAADEKDGIALLA